MVIIHLRVLERIVDVHGDGILDVKWLVNYYNNVLMKLGQVKVIIP